MSRGHDPLEARLSACCRAVSLLSRQFFLLILALHAVGAEQLPRLSRSRKTLQALPSLRTAASNLPKFAATEQASVSSSWKQHQFQIVPFSILLHALHTFVPRTRHQ